LANFPLPKNRKEKQEEIAELVKQIMVIKKQNAEANTSPLEEEIDRMVYQLYELTPAEIAVVEGKT
jgi:adenine-specific DNA-methyltransferase